MTKAPKAGANHKNPLSIATDPTTGDLYVSEYGNRVQEFSASGSYKASFGSTGSSSGQFSEPTGVAVSSSGTIFVGGQEKSAGAGMERRRTAYIYSKLYA